MGMKEGHSIKGRLRLILRDIESKRVIEERTARNAVMTGGSMLLANLFCGESTHPVSCVGVGLSSDNPEDRNLEGLVDPFNDLAIISNIDVIPDSAKHSAKVTFEATFGADKAVGKLEETGIFNGEGVLYNRVIFDPINKAENHELTLIWEITFSA